MGMYTEFHFAVPLRQELPEGLSDWFAELLSGETRDPFDNHPFFHCGRWSLVFGCSSAYHTTRGNSEFRPWTGDSWDHPELFIHTSLKNYDNEIRKFCDWISPFVDEYEGTMVGYHRYEEDELPTLLMLTRLPHNGDALIIDQPVTSA